MKNNTVSEYSPIPQNSDSFCPQQAEQMTKCFAPTLPTILLRLRLKRFFRFFRLTHLLKQVREVAAAKLQAWGRGWLVRKELRQLLSADKHKVLIWRHEGAEVVVVGTFSTNPWSERVPLVRSQLLGCFYSLFPIERRLRAATYFLKFIVDGRWLCDGNLPVAEDEAGNLNNVFYVRGSRCIPRAISARNLNADSSELAREVVQGTRPETVFVHRSLSSNNTPTKRGLVAETQPKEAVTLQLARYMVAKSAAKPTAVSADACFIDTGLHCFGVADGVGEWANYGLDASKFPRELMRNCQTGIGTYMDSFGELDISDLLEHVLYEAHAATTSFGSSTALLAMCHNSFLHCLNLGDSSLVVLRQREFSSTWHRIFRCVEQQHQFNCPYQLARLPKIAEYEKLENRGFSRFISLLKSGRTLNDSAFDAEAEMIPLKPGDVIIAGTDGLFDNMHEHEIIHLVERLWRSATHPRAEVVAEALAETAVKNARNSAYKSPFARSAKKAGRKFIGGKPDDITVVVGITA